MGPCPSGSQSAHPVSNRRTLKVPSFWLILMLTKCMLLSAFQHHGSQFTANDVGGHAGVQQEEGDGQYVLCDDHFHSGLSEGVLFQTDYLTFSCQLSHGILLGVVGTDIPLVEVMKLAPRYKVRFISPASHLCISRVVYMTG